MVAFTLRIFPFWHQLFTMKSLYRLSVKKQFWSDLCDSVCSDFFVTSDNRHNSCQLTLSINIFHSWTEQIPSSRNYSLFKLELIWPLQKRPECRIGHFRKRWQCRHRSSFNKSYLDTKLVQRGQ